MVPPIPLFMHKRYANKRYRNYPRSKNSGSILKKVINYYLPDCLGTFRSTFSLHWRRGSEETAICFTIMHFFFSSFILGKTFRSTIKLPTQKVSIQPFYRSKLVRWCNTCTSCTYNIYTLRVHALRSCEFFSAKKNCKTIKMYDATLAATVRVQKPCQPHRARST